MSIKTDYPKEKQLYAPLENSLDFLFEEDVWSYKIPDWGPSAKPFDCFVVLKGNPVAFEIKVIKELPERTTSQIFPGSTFTAWQKKQLWDVTRAGGYGIGLCYLRVKEKKHKKWREKFGIRHSKLINMFIAFTLAEIMAGPIWEDMIKEIAIGRPSPRIYPWDLLKKIWNFSQLERFLKEPKRWL